jgi:tryptophan-rich sensory protein
MDNDYMSKTKQITGLVVSLGLVFLVGWLGVIVTQRSLGVWYTSLIKPSWTPSGATIGLIWTIFYASMAIAAWSVWLCGGLIKQRRPLGFYAFQLLLNAGWTFLFFDLRCPGLALVEIIILWIAILVTLISFCRVSRFAAGLMGPYLIWVTIAAGLNAMIWRLN